MASIISAGTTSGTALNMSGDTSGNLAFQTSAGTYTITVPNETGTLLTNKTAGTVLQVVSATTSTQTTVSTSTFADTTLTATITPKFATSKILVTVNQNGVGKETNDTLIYLRLLRGSTTIVNIERYGSHTASGASNFIGSCSTSYLDSPATTSATTYKTQFASQANNAVIYVQSASGGTSSTSTITLMEIAG